MRFGGTPKAVFPWVVSTAILDHIARLFNATWIGNKGHLNGRHGRLEGLRSGAAATCALLGFLKSPLECNRRFRRGQLLAWHTCRTRPALSIEVAPQAKQPADRSRLCLVGLSASNFWISPTVGEPFQHFGVGEVRYSAGA
jgi:hypothetical protein